jgi:anti-sigma factor RsiW
LTTDEALRRARESGEALRATLRAHAVREPAPDALRARVLALAEPQKVPRAAPRWMALAASFCAVAFLAGYFLGSRQGPSPDQTALRPLVDSFARAEISGQPFDVASSDRHTVKPWLANRLTLGVEVVDLTEAGFPLAGGRVDIVDRLPVATLVYRHREHWIDVSELPPRPGATSGTSEASMLDGFRVRRWSDGARDYVAVSDIDAAEFDGFVEAFRRKSSLPASGAEPAPG